MNNFFLDPKLNSIADKVQANERLSFDDGVTLFTSDDLHGVGRLADIVRRRKHGLNTYFNSIRASRDARCSFVASTQARGRER